VLKFLAKVSEGALSDQVGLLNHNLATRLEIALLLADDGDPALGSSATPVTRPPRCGAPAT